MILVTGGTGLVGSHLLYQLVENGNDVIAIYRTKSTIDKVKNVFSYYTDNPTRLLKKIQWVYADLTDITSLHDVFKGVTEVYHAAAMISFAPKDYHQLRKVNIEGTANLVNVCIDYKIKKLCYVSSVAAVGKPLKGTVINEQNEWNVNDNNYGYAITKYGAEIEVWRGAQEGLDVVIVNPGIILGPGFWSTGSGKIFSQINLGFKFYTEGVTGFVGVEDTVKIMIHLMNSSIKNERFILVSENVSFKHVFFTIANLLGKKPPSIKATKFLGAIGWRIEAIRSWLIGSAPLLTKHSVKSAHNHYTYSNDKIVNAINYHFEPLSTTLAKTCKNFQKH
ncbi:NAD-dependent epimerase/dehydratase family protein [Flavobacteriaceae bacterium F08102]|nr:NAD-dependent epimerase/dehydratase family protein [Flavobacteriaceae bacterium F08102]